MTPADNPLVISEHHCRLLAGFCDDIVALADALPLGEFPEPLQHTLTTVRTSFAALRHLLDNPYTPTTTILAQLGT